MKVENTVSFTKVIGKMRSCHNLRTDPTSKKLAGKGRNRSFGFQPGWLVSQNSENPLERSQRVDSKPLHSLVSAGPTPSSSPSCLTVVKFNEDHLDTNCLSEFLLLKRYFK